MGSALLNLEPKVIKLIPNTNDCVGVSIHFCLCVVDDIPLSFFFFDRLQDPEWKLVAFLALVSLHFEYICCIYIFVIIALCYASPTYSRNNCENFLSVFMFYNLVYDE